MVWGLELIKWRLDIARKEIPTTVQSVILAEIAVHWFLSRLCLQRWKLPDGGRQPLVYHWSQKMWRIDAAGQGNSPRIHARPMPINVTGGSRRSFLERWHTTTDTSKEVPSSLDWDLLAGILGFYFANVSKSCHFHWEWMVSARC